MLLIFTKPLMPKVEGKNHETAFQNGGTAHEGHEMPEMNSNGTEANTNMMMNTSRLWAMPEMVMLKNTHANRYGNRNATKSVQWPI